MACGCGKKNRKRALPRARSAALPDPPKGAGPFRTSWRAVSSDGEEASSSFSTLQDARAWVRDHAGWRVETVRTRI